MVFDVIIVSINVHGRRSRMTGCVFLCAPRPQGGASPTLKLKALIQTRMQHLTKGDTLHQQVQQL